MKRIGEIRRDRTFSRDITEKELVFPGRMGSFVQFVAHAEVNGGPWTSVAAKAYYGYSKGRRKPVKAFQAAANAAF
jgi:hypothetical protein